MSGTLVVLVAVLVVWLGVFGYLLRLDRKISRAEQGKRK